MPAEFLAHAHPCVLYRAPIGRPAILRRAQLPDKIADAAPGGGVFHRVAQDVQLDLLHFQGVEKGDLVLDVPGHLQLQALFVHVGGEDALHVLQGIGDAVGPQVQLGLAAFDAGHVQHVADEPQQMLPGQVDLLQAVPHPVRLVQILLRHGGEAHDGV